MKNKHDKRNQVCVCKCSKKHTQHMRDEVLNVQMHALLQLDKTRHGKYNKDCCFYCYLFIYKKKCERNKVKNIL